MCYHKQQRQPARIVAGYYQATLDTLAVDLPPIYHENSFAHRPSLLLTSDNPGRLTVGRWGLIPTWAKNNLQATQIKSRTTNCISEDMFEKPAFRTAARAGHRCLIPCTGFFEWRHLADGKTKIPYFIYSPDDPIFSLGGLWTRYDDPDTQETSLTYTVLTTAANPLMEIVHNSKKRMPVIIPRTYEKDWLGDKLTEQDVRQICAPSTIPLSAYTISKRITDKKLSKDVPEVFMAQTYPGVEAVLGG